LGFGEGAGEGARGWEGCRDSGCFCKKIWTADLIKHKLKGLVAK
jgi:hypothetical protein